MNRDNALFALMGLVLGFVFAYPVFEAMSSRQPALRRPGAVPEPVAGEGDAAAGGAGGPAVEEVRRLREYVEANPGDADAVRALAQLNLQIGDLIRARDLLDRYLDLQPEDAQALRISGNLHYESRQFAAATERYERYLDLEPADADVLTDLGTSYRSLGEPQRALELFRRAQEVEPDDWIARYNEVVVLAFDLGDFGAAEAALGELKALQPDNEQVTELAAEVERQQAASGA